LHQYLQSLPGECVHFVAHSLGGIVLMHYFHLYKDVRPGRVVLLGSPVAGSERASQFNQLPFMQTVMGKSTEQGLLGEVPPWSGGRDLGMIAGSRSIGVGNLLGRSTATNDGIVYVYETQVPGLTDHVVLPTSHSGMLISDKVAQQVIHFIKNGYFSLAM
jgi:pimeloyl-ACP methyl ester carboxylesterase